MILVAGATGKLGSEIVRRLRAKGEEVRGLVRTTSAPENVSRLKALGAETVTGNLRERASLDQACSGVTTVISTVTIIGTAQPGDTFEDTDAAGTMSLIDAAKSAGAERFIFVSFDSARFPETPLTAAKRSVEKHLRESGIGYTILQPALFMEAWLGPMLFGDPSTGQVKIFGEGEGRIPYISAADVAEIAVRSVTAPSARNATITFGGPEGVTQKQAVALFEEAEGKPMTVTAVPEEALEAKWQAAENPFEKTFAGLMLGVARLNQEAAPLDESMRFQMATVRDFVKSRTQH